MPAPGPLFAFGIVELTNFVTLIGAIVALVFEVRRHGYLGGPPKVPDPIIAPAARAGGAPWWLFYAISVVCMVLFCGGCGISLISRKRDPGPPPAPTTKQGDDSGGGKKKDSPPADPQAGRKVPVNRPIEAWDERIVVTLESVEFRKNNRMRWHVTIANTTGREIRIPVYPTECSLVDQNGTKLTGVEHSALSHNGVAVADGETKPYWIDFPVPAPGSTRLVATFPAAAGGYHLSSFGLELVPGPDGPGVSADSLVRRVVIGKPLATWNPQITCTLESVEFRPDGRMRWRFSFWNRSGVSTDVYTYPEPSNTFLTDEKGTSYPGVGHITATTNGSALPDGVKVPVWVEFRSPPPDAAWLTARFGAQPSTGPPFRKIPNSVLHLPPGKAGPMASLTFAADAGAAVVDETLDLTIGGGSAKLHLSKHFPRAEATAFVPVGTEVRYAVKATTQVNLNGKEATFSGAGSGSYPVPADRRLVFVRDTAAGFNNFRALFQEPR